VAPPGPRLAMVSSVGLGGAGIEAPDSVAAIDSEESEFLRVR